MTKEHYKIDIDGMHYLVIAVYTDYKIRGLENPYTQLMDQVESYKMNNTPFDPTIHKIDDFMVDAYKIYDRYTAIEGELGDKLKEILASSELLNIFDFDEEKIKEEFEKVTSTFEDIINNCNFDRPEIRGIQKNILLENMNVAVAVEDYELAAILRDKINNI